MGGGWEVKVTAKLPNNAGEASQTFKLFVEAVSKQSIVNQGKETATPEATPAK
jgi:hypothetical protein